MQWSKAWSSANRRPVLVIDTAHADNFKGWPHVEGFEATSRAIWQQGRSVAWWPGFGKASVRRARFDAVMQGVLRCGGVNLLIDESSAYLSATRGTGGPLELICKIARHLAVTVSMTTQYAGRDLSPEVLALEPDVFLFRSKALRALRRIEEEWGVPMELVKTMPARHFVRV